MNKAAVRDAKLSDVDRILEIYSYYVVNTAVTFEYTVPDREEFLRRMKETMKKYPYLVIEQNGVVQGYAYAGPFKTRAAYDWTVEMTVYLAHDVQRCGMGRTIYEQLEKKLKDMGILNLYACIGYPEQPDEYLSRNSAEFHEHIGYHTVGYFKQCGYKFNRWYDMIWMEKIIGDHNEEQSTVIPYQYS